jgi:hypothetical protein
MLGSGCARAEEHPGPLPSRFVLQMSETKDDPDASHESLLIHAAYFLLVDAQGPGLLYIGAQQLRPGGYTEARLGSHWDFPN